MTREKLSVIAALHLITTVLVWTACLYVMFAYSWQVGFVLLLLIEARVMFAVAIRTARMLGGAA